MVEEVKQMILNSLKESCSAISFLLYGEISGYYMHRYNTALNLGLDKFNEALYEMSNDGQIKLVEINYSRNGNHHYYLIIFAADTEVNVK